VEDRIAAYITRTREKALEQARAVDRQIRNGEKISPLAGIPVAVKDNICTDGILTTAASRMLAGFVPPYSATVVKRLEAAGATLPGKTNLDEFAMGSSTENSAFFTTRNPWDTGRVPGGSSGGSAAAVACGEAVCALGSDTGGSIRLPASFCGVIGFKPTYGAVSRYGLIAFASSLDQIGPFSRDVTDCALLLNAICGHDPLDSTSARFDVPDFTRFLVNDIRGMKIGVPEEYMAEGINSGVREVVVKAIALLESLGASVEYTNLPHTEYALSTYYLIAPAEASIISYKSGTRDTVISLSTQAWTTLAFCSWDRVEQTNTSSGSTFTKTLQISSTSPSTGGLKAPLPDPGFRPSALNCPGCGVLSGPDKTSKTTPSTFISLPVADSSFSARARASSSLPATMTLLVA
jgi:Asp-tRNA(Asn)/Glu-tRNA(Gln) amidotransferase A subunit family amidase